MWIVSSVMYVKFFNIKLVGSSVGIKSIESIASLDFYFPVFVLQCMLFFVFLVVSVPVICSLMLELCFQTGSSCCYAGASL